MRRFSSRRLTAVVGVMSEVAVVSIQVGPGFTAQNGGRGVVERRFGREAG
jgi:hypothetical protein